VVGMVENFCGTKNKRWLKMMYRLDYRCFVADLQGENEGDYILDSKKLINNKKEMNSCLKKKKKPVRF
jgi:hypothetical protein